MEIQMTLQGTLIYVSMATYIIALIFTLCRRERLGLIFFAFGFIVSLTAFIYRWVHVAHWPMQNLFEVFLSLGMLCFPVSLFCRHFLKVDDYGTDMFIGVVLLFPAGFIFSAESQPLPPVLQSPLFAPHVAVYMIAYALMFKAAFCAIAQLIDRKPKSPFLSPEQATYTLICLGFPFLTLGLILGSVWGKFAWGDYWGWDPKELWSLASWLVYAIYFHFRYISGARLARMNSAFAITGMVFILITLLWVNLSRIFPGLHNYAS